MMKILIKTLMPLSLALMITYSIPAFSEDTAVLDLKFERNQDLDPKNAYPNKNLNCEVLINKPEDNRLYKDNLGPIGFDRPALSNHPVDEWLESVLLGMSSIGIKTSTSPNANNNNIRLTTKLNKLYVWYHNLRLYSTIVLEVDYKNSLTGSGLTKTYRVTGSKPNWIGADSEFAATINNTANRLIEQIGIDLEKQCAAASI